MHRISDVARLCWGDPVKMASVFLLMDITRIAPCEVLAGFLHCEDADWECFGRIDRGVHTDEPFPTHWR